MSRGLACVNIEDCSRNPLGWAWQYVSMGVAVFPKDFQRLGAWERSS
jgi:hypothetical protein